MALRTLDELDVAGKRVLLRADLNVPVDEDGRVGDDARIRAAARTIKEILDRGGLPIVLSHLGRPRGEPDPALSLRATVEPLSRALGGVPVRFAEDCVGAKAEAVVDGVRPGEERAVVLLENLRFHPGEEDNDPAFADALARLGDAYVGDAFSAAHRAHASIVGLAERLPAAAGRLMEAEVRCLTRVLRERQHLYLALFGGAKVGTKLGALGALICVADVAALGGGMANTVLHAQGVGVGASLCEADKADEARRMLEAAKQVNCEVVLPSDAVVAREPGAGAERRTVPIGEVPEDGMILDIGPETVARIVDRVRWSRTVIWNGPLGAAEHEGFEAGTRRVAEAIAERTRGGELTSIVGGGDTVAALSRLGVLEQFSCVSLAGGAFLEWLRGKDLPGVAALSTDTGAA